MTGTQIALIRGINVGRAKRVAMADLRALLAELGHPDVRTLLNSGNVVYSADDDPAAMAVRLQDAMLARLRVPARVIVLTASELASVIAANPLTSIATNPSRLLVTVWQDASDRPRLDALAGEHWGTEQLAVGDRAAYVWCPDGILASRLPDGVARALGDRATTRNWGTMTKLQALAGTLGERRL
jgi:uncharacterized protein (DUF1697 family)